MSSYNVGLLPSAGVPCISCCFLVSHIHVPFHHFQWEKSALKSEKNSSLWFLGIHRSNNSVTLDLVYTRKVNYEHFYNYFWLWRRNITVLIESSVLDWKYNLSKLLSSNSRWTCGNIKWYWLWHQHSIRRQLNFAVATYLFIYHVYKSMLLTKKIFYIIQSATCRYWVWIQKSITKTANAWKSSSVS